MQALAERNSHPERTDCHWLPQTAFVSEATGERIRNLTLVCFDKMREDLMRLLPSFSSFDVHEQKSVPKQCDISIASRAAVLQAFSEDLMLYEEACMDHLSGGGKSEAVASGAMQSGVLQVEEDESDESMVMDRVEMQDAGEELGEVVLEREDKVASCSAAGSKIEAESVIDHKMDVLIYSPCQLWEVRCLSYLTLGSETCLTCLGYVRSTQADGCPVTIRSTVRCARLKTVLAASSACGRR